MVRVLAAVAMMVGLSTGTAFAAVLGGTAAGDALSGTNGADTIRGGGRGDILRSMGGSDGGGDDRLKDRSVYGGGSDHVYGGSGSDNPYSGPGNDFISSADDGAADYVDCGDGHDTVKRGSDTNLDRFVGFEEFVN
jgi:Ca2+-binding RTX toxin-like protein